MCASFVHAASGPNTRLTILVVPILWMPHTMWKTYGGNTPSPNVATLTLHDPHVHAQPRAPYACQVRLAWLGKPRGL